MLLIVYSFININNVSWGTREVVLTATEQQQAQQAAKEKAATEVRKKSIVDMVSSLWKGGKFVLTQRRPDSLDITNRFMKIKKI